MGEATTRRRAPSPSNTRKFVEADARSTDLLPKSSTSHARRPSTNFLQVREEPEFILHDLAGPYPVQNSPSTPGSAAHPVQNSPSKRPWQAHPVQNSPSEPQNADFGPFFACRENFLPLPPPTRRAGRKKSRTNTPPHPNNVPLSKFRMQFDCVSFQQSPETLQSQRSQFKSQNTPRGIACEIDEAGFERAGGSGGHGRAPEKPAAVSAGSGRAKTEQKSHIISCGHFSRPPTNGAIATIQIHGLKHAQGNYVRNC